MKIYGIKNCDTMKKALKWLDAQAAAYEFHDYKKAGLSSELADTFLANIEIEQLINKRGTTYRALDEDTKAKISALDKSVAKQVMLDNPSIIKRPVLEHNGQYLLGFKAEQYQEFV
ncbi:ArsC family reductase [Bermanella sp. WJH001]|uniref:ArsC family reductase n=1 Tax=Bermanella sp. WJH001 TaxID=3048005 RepID=UPI0024BEE4FE|nr:ArsC family reductase [Bermanella sp. WJH001]MDJ1537380.1 ArsC family reductase [Bermanella sp. WJH001]